jgi:hypothetical protein
VNFRHDRLDVLADEAIGDRDEVVVVPGRAGFGTDQLAGGRLLGGQLVAAGDQVVALAGPRQEIGDGNAEGRRKLLELAQIQRRLLVLDLGELRRRDADQDRQLAQRQAPALPLAADALADPGSAGIRES